MASMDGGQGKSRKAQLDRISSLPNEILSQILSVLPTKCAVGTSILSNRWKYLWTSITSFDLKSPPSHNVSQVVDFTLFVDKVFRSCTSSQIQKFSLHVCWNDTKRVTAWLDEAVKHNAREVDIDVYQLPLSIFTCKTVSVLKLSLPYCDDTNIVSFDLPCLKVLHIKWGGYRRGLLEKLISSSPVLEHLTLVGYFTDENFMVSSSALRVLQLQPSNHKSPVTLSVEAPTLEYLHLDKVSVKHNIKGDFSCLVKASVYIDDLSSFRRRRRIPQFFALPKFHNLTFLEVVARDNRFWAILPKLLRSSPSLEVLSLEQVKYRMPRYDHNWVEPKSIPKCFRFHLAVIKIKGFKGNKDELQLVKYVLGNAKVLKSLSINCRGLLTQVKESQFYGKLSKFARASGSCQIQFHGDIISNL